MQKVLPYRIVADDRIPFLRGVLEPYFREVVYLPGSEISRTALKDAAVLLTRTRTRCDAALLSGTPVRLILTATIGFDHLDLAYLEKAHIFWSNAPGCNAGSVRQYVVSALLRLALRHDFSFSGKVLGVIGVGNVGTLVAAAGRALGMTVLLNDPPRAEREGNEEFVALKEIQERADFLTLHVPLTEDGPWRTRHLVDGKFLGKLRRNAFFLNTSRGEVCDNDALLAALERGKLAGAVLDVWEHEPEIHRELLRKVEIGTPHIAGYSADGKANGTAYCVRKLADFFEIGELLRWYPPILPEPNPDSAEPFDGRPDLREIFLNNGAYDVGRDDAALRDHPETFEQLRNHYPVRREGQAAPGTV